MVYIVKSNEYDIQSLFISAILDNSINQNATIDNYSILEQVKHVKRLFSPQELSTNSHFGQYTSSGKVFRQRLNKKYSESNYFT